MSFGARSASVWIDRAGASTAVGGADFKENSLAKGLHSLAQPVEVKLPSGLAVELSCERIATGHFHVGISHNGKLYSMGKYAGPFDVRVFPDGHSSYVVSVRWEA